MSRPIKQLLRSGLVFAVSLVVILGLALPAPAGRAILAGSTQASPEPRNSMGMAFDAARGDAVLFGGYSNYGVFLADTWTWDGTGWTKLAPAHSPPGRWLAAMVYDAARSRVVLFGGHNSTGYLRDTWTWDGTDWTELAPAHSPNGAFMGMAYDGARGDVVAFDLNGNTWTLDGASWTKLAPAHSPPARFLPGMASDADGSNVVLFGGKSLSGELLNDTWAWEGTDWTRLAPAHSPSPREEMGMAFDADRNQVVVFDGGGGDFTADTWVWDGADWTRLAPAHSPSQRYSPGMAFDAARSEVVLFGGETGAPSAGDTWTWDGTDWTQRPAGTLAKLSPHSGPAGTVVVVQGWGFAAGEGVRLMFVDSGQGTTSLRKVKSGVTGAFNAVVTIPPGATLGTQHVKARGVTSGEIARRAFTVT
jgi:hypothetical protein